MKTVDELMALADAYARATREESNALENCGPSEFEEANQATHKARAALLTALQEVTSSEAMYQGWYEDAYERRADLELDVMALEGRLIECKRSVDAHMAQYSNFLNTKDTDITSEEQVEYNRLEELVAYLEHMEGQESVHAIDISAERVEKSREDVQVQPVAQPSDEALLRQSLEYLDGTVQVSWSKPLIDSIRARLERGV